MQPFSFEGPASFNPSDLAASIGATWRAPSSLLRDGITVSLIITQADTGVRISLAHNWHWPWRWAAAGRLEGDVLKQLAQQGIRGKNEVSQEALDEA